MDKEILDNHKLYSERKALFKSFGYDIDEERALIIRQSEPIIGKILEAGTGKGYFAIELAKQGYNFTTFDISQIEQSFARLNLRYFGLEKQVRLCIENAEALSFKDKTFDVVLSINTIHHLANPFKVINELLRVLSSEGKLILSDFTKEGLALMDKIHASQSRQHESGKTTFFEIEKYLIKMGLNVEKSGSKFQDILKAYHHLK